MELKIIEQDFSICKVADLSQIDYTDEFCFIGKTDEEISLVCSSYLVPKNVIEQDNGWKAFRIQGVLDFSLIGILSKISTLLADNQIGIFAISTYNTDYILVKQGDFEKAISILQENGYNLTEPAVDEVKEQKACGKPQIKEDNISYEGLLIKESVENEDILDSLAVNKVELWKTDNAPRYWTAISFTSNVIDLPERFAKVMIDGKKTGVSWFVDFKRNNVKYIVFRDLILKYTIGNQEELDEVITMCRKQGIPDEQMNWAE